MRLSPVNMSAFKAVVTCQKDFMSTCAVFDNFTFDVFIIANHITSSTRLQMLFLTQYVPQFEFTVSLKQQVIVTNAVSDKCDWITDT